MQDTAARLMDVLSLPAWQSDRFWPRVDLAPLDACWLWRGGVNGRGYGYVRVSGLAYGVQYTAVHAAHRIAWALAHGEAAPDGQVVDHLCNHPPCCRPDHLQVASYSENTRLAFARERALGTPEFATTSSLRVVTLASGAVHYKVHFRDRLNGSVLQRSRTFASLEDASAFRVTLRDRSISDLCA